MCYSENMKILKITQENYVFFLNGMPLLSIYFPQIYEQYLQVITNLPVDVGPFLKFFSYSIEGWVCSQLFNLKLLFFYNLTSNVCYTYNLNLQ